MTELTLVKQIEQELVKENVTDKVLSELEANFLPLKIKDFNDKEGYKKVKEARLKCKELRVLATKICKAGRENAVKIQKAWLAEEKRVVDRISVVEKYLEKQEDDFEAEKERIKKEEEARAQQKLQDRIKRLLDAGMLFDGIRYSVGNVDVPASDVAFLKDELFDELPLKALAESARIKEEKRLEEERIQKEKEEEEARRRAEEERLKAERDELDRIRKEQEVEQKRIADEREAIEKEKWDLARSKRKIRCQQLCDMGLVYNGSEYSLKELNISDSEVSLMDDEEWVSIINKFTPRISEIKEQQKQEQECLAKERELQDQAEKERKEREQKEAEIAEQKRQEALRPDKEKLLALAISLKEMEMPEVVSMEAEFVIGYTKIALANLHDFIVEKSNSL